METLVKFRNESIAARVYPHWKYIFDSYFTPLAAAALITTFRCISAENAKVKEGVYALLTACNIMEKKEVRAGQYCRAQAKE